jgi:hypothetical protein
LLFLHQFVLLKQQFRHVAKIRYCFKMSHIVAKRPQNKDRQRIE